MKVSLITIKIYF